MPSFAQHLVRRHPGHHLHRPVPGNDCALVVDNDGGVG